MVFIPKSVRYKEVEDETVLITGGGSGIGRLLALKFARLGCRVVVWDVNKEANDETAEIARNEGGECRSYVCDVSNRSEVYATAQKVKVDVGSVTMLINNAGIVTGKLFMECPDEKIEKTFRVNALAHFWACKAFLPDMMAANHGHIVTIASVAGLFGFVKLSDYCASKFAAVGFHESLNLELKKQRFDGIKTTLVCTHVIDTGMFKGAESRFIGFLDPDHVADEIVSAIRINQPMALIPRILYVFYFIKGILPISALKQGHHTLKADEAMDNFVGRH